MSSQFFSSTPKQRWTLLFVIVVLVGAVCHPRLESLMIGAFRSQPFETEEIAVEIPWTWLARENNRTVWAWTPCLTIFCRAERSSLSIAMDDELVGMESDWREVAKSAVEDGGFVFHGEHMLQGTSGAAICFEATNGANPDQLRSVCFGGARGLVACFGGAREDIGDFYAMVESVQRVNVSPGSARGER